MQAAEPSAPEEGFGYPAWSSPGGVVRPSMEPVVPNGPNKVMDAADTAVGARGVDKPRKRKVPSPTSA